ncbi:MAG: alpha-glucosidase [Clostridia bacterium]|nr:alpha-glucosidase [Clostridia bacterium]
METEELIFYQIYPRSFCDSNGDGIGDIRGIISKMDYLKALGINAVWLSPCFPSPNKDNGYDVSDYCAISPELGTMQDFEQMLAMFHKNGIKLILDFVANHTSTEHEWFQQSRSAKDNPYRNYYIWRKQPPNDWKSLFGGSAWEYDETTGEYYLHSFAKEQADLNYENPSVRKEMQNVIDFWAEKGVDGFRCDVLDMIAKDFIKHKNGNGTRLHEYIRELFGRKKTSRLFTVGECWGSSAKNVALFCAPERRELTAVFNFEHLCLQNDRFSPRKPKLRTVCQRMAKWQKLMQKNGLLPTLFLENHDQPRSVSRFGDDKKYRYESATALGALVLLHRGIPFLYQGEEIGMTNSHHKTIEDFDDIETRNYYFEKKDKMHQDVLLRNVNAGTRDNARRAIAWTEENVATYLPAYSEKERVNVHKDLQAEKSVYGFYQKLIALRRNAACFTRGEYRLIALKNYYRFERRFQGETYQIIVCFAKPCRLPKLKGELVLNNYKTIGSRLKPYQVLVYKKPSGE